MIWDGKLDAKIGVSTIRWGKQRFVFSILSEQTNLNTTTSFFVLNILVFHPELNNQELWEVKENDMRESKACWMVNGEISQLSRKIQQYALGHPGLQPESKDWREIIISQVSSEREHSTALKQTIYKNLFNISKIDDMMERATLTAR